MLLVIIALLLAFSPGIYSASYKAEDLDQQKMKEAENCLKYQLCNISGPELYHFHNITHKYPELQKVWMKGLKDGYEEIVKKLGGVAEFLSYEWFKDLELICQLTDPERYKFFADFGTVMGNCYKENGCEEDGAEEKNEMCAGMSELVEDCIVLIRDLQDKKYCLSDFTGEWMKKQASLAEENGNDYKEKAKVPGQYPG